MAKPTEPTKKTVTDNMKTNIINESVEMTNALKIFKSDYANQCKSVLKEINTELGT
jgi:uncharacterized protein YejL (UPF0352 family)